MSLLAVNALPTFGTQRLRGKRFRRYTRTNLNPWKFRKQSCSRGFASSAVMLHMADFAVSPHEDG